MYIDFDTLDPKARYKLLTACVIPRPVAWTTTISGDGVVNAAPYSFFNVFGEAPALIVLGVQTRPDGTPKDTTRNIRTSGDFVVNIATEAETDLMVETAAPYPPEAGEPDAIGLATRASTKVKAPRLAIAPVAFECRLITIMGFAGDRELIVGEALALHAREGLIDRERLYVDWQGKMPIGRLFADRYARTVEIEPKPIPAPRSAS
ncbi:MAG: flavin reductase family protein [Paracoccaceae bacterium]